MSHSYPKKIYYHDTDCGGIVYYANYLKYFEEARTEFLTSRGIRLDELARRDILFVVGSVHISYRAPARYGDTIEVGTEIESRKNVSLTFVQRARREEELLVEAVTRLVCVGGDLKPRRIPPEIEALF